MKQPMRSDQGQQCTEIPPLPNGKGKHTIRQLLRKGYNDISFASSQPALQPVPPFVIDLDATR